MVKPGNRIRLGFLFQDLWICAEMEFTLGHVLSFIPKVTGHLLCACVHAKSLQSCPTLCDPMDCSPPGSSVHGVLQAKYWSGLPCPSPGDLHDARIKPRLLCPLHWQARSLPLVSPGKSPLALCLMLNAWNRITNKSKIISVLKKLTFCWGGVCRK